MQGFWVLHVFSTKIAKPHTHTHTHTRTHTHTHTHTCAGSISADTGWIASTVSVQKPSVGWRGRHEDTRSLPSCSTQKRQRETRCHIESVTCACRANREHAHSHTNSGALKTPRWRSDVDPNIISMCVWLEAEGKVSISGLISSVVSQHPHCLLST